jgi:hypothetical protein
MPLGYSRQSFTKYILFPLEYVSVVAGFFLRILLICGGSSQLVVYTI